MDSGQLPPTDQELARRAQRGDAAAFHQLVDRHGASLYCLAVNLVGDPSDAEDVLQETFAGAFRGLRTFGERASVKTWLTGILLRQAAMHHRTRRRRRTVPLDAQPPQASPAGGAQRRADVRLDVGEAIQRLGHEHREVIVLRELQGLAYEEIAAVLAIPRGTVESRLFRARRELQGLLKDYLT